MSKIYNNTEYFNAFQHKVCIVGNVGARFESIVSLTMLRMSNAKKHKNI